MLQRRQAPRSGISRGGPDRREFRKHRQFVRGFVCYAMKADGDACRGKVQFCHFRSAANSGTGLLPPDWFGFPGCEHHHIFVQHVEGQKAVERRYGVDLQKEATRLAKISPDKDMREAMRAAGAL